VQIDKYSVIVIELKFASMPPINAAEPENLPLQKFVEIILFHLFRKMI